MDIFAKVLSNRIKRFKNWKRARNFMINEIMFEHDRGASNTDISRLMGIPESSVMIILKEEK